MTLIAGWSLVFGSGSGSVASSVSDPSRNIVTPTPRIRPSASRGSVISSLIGSGEPEYAPAPSSSLAMLIFRRPRRPA